MKCNQLTTTLRRLNQPKSLVYFDPPDGKGGLYAISATHRLATEQLPHVVLCSLGTMDRVEPMTAEDLRRFLCGMPGESDVLYDDSDVEPFSKLVPVQHARPVHRIELDGRGFSETNAPAVLLSTLR